MERLKQPGPRQGQKARRTLKQGEMNLILGNRRTSPVSVIGDFDVSLSSGVSFSLLNCCYSSEMTRNIISFHALFEQGSRYNFDNNNGDILVYKDGCFMFKDSPCNGIYESVVCVSNNVNVNLNIDSTNEVDKSCLWHYRLGHIKKKRIAKL